MNPLRALIVEDEVIIRWDLKTTLERLGVEVVSLAMDMESAVEAARSDSPDFILMDISLRGTRSGIDAAREIRSFSDTPIFLLTGNSSLKNEFASLGTMVQGIYAKPVAEGQLQEILEKARSKV